MMPEMNRNAAMAAMYREGLTLRELAALNGISQQRVAQIIRKLGVKREDRPSRRKLASADTQRINWLDICNARQLNDVFADLAHGRSARESIDRSRGVVAVEPANDVTPHVTPQPEREATAR